MSLRTIGIGVKIFDKSNNLIKEFPTITSAAGYFGVDIYTIKKIFKTGISHNDFISKFEVKDNRICVYDSNHNLVITLNSIQKVSIWCNIARSTVSNYINTGNICKGKYYFYRINYKSNFS